MAAIDDVIAAVYRKDRKTLGLLLAAGADIDGADKDGRTPLMHAVLDSNPDPSFIRHLLESGATPEITDTNQRWTALHFAAQAQVPDVVFLLVAAGAQVDAQDAFGNTPLWRAVMTPYPNTAVIDILLRGGADPMMRNGHGVSPLDLVRKRGLRKLEWQLERKPS
jgi:ankyrin repeat protein